MYVRIVSSIFYEGVTHSTYSGVLHILWVTSETDLVPCCNLVTYVTGPRAGLDLGQQHLRPARPGRGGGEPDARAAAGPRPRGALDRAAVLWRCLFMIFSNHFYDWIQIDYFYFS